VVLVGELQSSGYARRERAGLEGMGLVVDGGRTDFLVPGSRDTIVKAQFMRTSSFLICSPFLGALATCMVISRLLRPVA
jgi:hypothetical protein